VQLRLTWLDSAVNKIATGPAEAWSYARETETSLCTTQIVPSAFHHAIRPRHDNSVSVIETALKPLKRQRFRNAVSLKAVRALK
jgi:hypothetical protein